MAIFLGGQREKNRQKEGHSGGTYAYEKYREYPPSPRGIHSIHRKVKKKKNSLTGRLYISSYDHDAWGRGGGGGGGG